MMKKATAVLDFGTSKVLVLLAEESAYQKVTITTAGMAQYDGFKNGEWNAPSDVSDAIASAVEAAEKKVGTHIKEVYVGVPGEFVRVYVIESSVALQGADPKVTSADVEKLQRQATEMLDRPTGVIIHRSPAWFKVDGGQKTLEPVDQKGSMLEGMIGFVLADQFFINDVTERLKELGIEVRGFFSTSVGEAMQMIPFEERDHTAILVDVGYLSTEVMAVEGDALIWQKVLPVGGAHITLDLTYGLEKPFDMCEKIKRGYTFNAPKNTQIEVQGENGQMESFSGEQVSMIIDARVDEMLEMIDDAVKKSGIRLGNWSNVYFTGGGLMPMGGARVYAAGKLARNVREAAVKTVKLKPAQIYASGSGLLELLEAVGVDVRDHIGVALGRHAALDQHVHAVDVDVLQDARVVRDDDERAVAALAVHVHAAGNHGQRVHVKAGVGFVKEGQFRLKQQQLQHFELLLFAAGKAHAQLAVQVGRVHVQFLGQFLHVLAELLALHVADARTTCGNGAQEAADGHAGNLDRRLEAQEKARVRALVSGQVCDILAIERNFAAGYRIFRVAHDHVAKGGFAGAVRAHQHVGLTCAHGQVNVVQDDLLVNSGGKARHVEEDVLVCHLLPLFISLKYDYA